MNNDISIPGNKFVPAVSFKLIPIKNLVANQDYQRNLSESHIIKAAENFDLYQINPVKVSRRDGINFVFDGQHTIEIVALVSGSRETPVWCMVYDDLNYKHEAQIFAEQQKYVKSLAPYETFKANIEAGSEKHILILDLVHSYHLDVTSAKVQGGICAVAALEYIFDKYDYHVLDRTLRLCVGTWEGEPYSLTANMIKGVALLVHVYGDNLRDDNFVDRIGHTSAKTISRTAKDRRAGALGYAEALLIEYNRKSKYRLSMRKLYDDRCNPFVSDDTDSDDYFEDDYQDAFTENV